MQAKEIEAKLYHYGELKHREESLKKQWDLVLEEKEARIERTTRPFGERLPDSNKVHDPTGDAVCVIARRYDAMVNSIVAQLATVQEQIAAYELAMTMAGVTELELQYIRARYVECRKIDDVCSELSYSERKVNGIRRGIVGKMEKSSAFTAL